MKHLLKTNIHQLFCFLIEVLHKRFCCVWHWGQTQQWGLLSLCSFLILSESCFVAWLHLPINFHVTFFELSDFYTNSLDILSSAFPPDRRCSLQPLQLPSNFSKSSSRPSFSTLPTSHPMWCTWADSSPWCSTQIWMYLQEGDHNLVSYLLLTWICTPSVLW